MKKISKKNIFVLLTLTLAFCVNGCKKTSNSENEKTKTTETIKSQVEQTLDKTSQDETNSDSEKDISDYGIDIGKEITMLDKLCEPYIDVIYCFNYVGSGTYSTSRSKYHSEVQYIVDKISEVFFEGFTPKKYKKVNVSTIKRQLEILEDTFVKSPDYNNLIEFPGMRGIIEKEDRDECVKIYITELNKWIAFREKTAKQISNEDLREKYNDLTNQFLRFQLIDIKNGLDPWLAGVGEDPKFTIKDGYLPMFCTDQKLYSAKQRCATEN